MIMAKKLTGLLNPLYIEQYGVTFVKQTDYDWLNMKYKNHITTDYLKIDYNKMELINEVNSKYKLKPATEENFKPFYFMDELGLDNNQVLHDMYKYRQRYEHEGEPSDKTIDNDIRVTKSIVRVLEPTLKIKPLYQPKGHFGGGNWFDLASGFWWGAMMGGAYNDNNF